ncbi:hypothetical protein FGU71_04675 [Erythrobacter insulae]|uniref:Uncharacterized protein n=1 Tax=Erythrobacter insulae TaxID=2584124 RepID=A0A547PAQ3_9SPHN|nr:hypothetical protein [Erythrobacter insulae]TRD11215.1 hypothetical protein FGU71_04675 [Erythrobacter insulae]
MIDYIALSVGHGLLAFAFWHLFMRSGVDVDPLIGDIRDAEKANRQATSIAGRNAQRRTKTEGAKQSGVRSR